jgi:hypothetical protein
LKESGTHIAFVGGTGILAFVDLVALMLRANLGMLEPDEIPPQLKTGSTFKFVLYASFENKKDGLGFDLLEGLYEVTKKLNLKNFDLVIRLSVTGSRWDADFIKRQIQIRSSETIERIWVCGPPVMNELFDKTFEEMRQEGELKLNRQQVEIM